MTASESVADSRVVVLDCVRTIFPFLPEDQVAVATKESLAEWDSLATLSLITMIEETLDLMLTDDEVQEFHSVEGIQAVLARRAAAGA